MWLGIPHKPFFWCKSHVKLFTRGKKYVLWNFFKYIMAFFPFHNHLHHIASVPTLKNSLCLVINHLNLIIIFEMITFGFFHSSSSWSIKKLGYICLHLWRAIISINGWVENCSNLTVLVLLHSVTTACAIDCYQGFPNVNAYHCNHIKIQCFSKFWLNWTW
jgi:hypothetical protein